MALLLFRDSNFLGGQITRTSDDSTLVNDGFNDVVSSVIVTGGEVWTLFQDINFQGVSVTVAGNSGPNRNGQYPNANSLGGRNDFFSSVRRDA